MVSIVSPMTSDQKSKSGKKKFKKNALEYVDYDSEFKKDPKFKTELCKTFTDTAFCAYGNKCRFAHGKDELFNRSANHPKYRKSDCLTFHSNGYCNYGARCHFRHHETRKLNNIPLSFFSMRLAIYHTKTTPDLSTHRLPVFSNLTGTSVVKCHPEVMNNIRRIMESSHSTLIRTEPIKPRTTIFKQDHRKLSNSSAHSKSPISSTATISPNDSMILWKNLNSINRKLNFNDVNESEAFNH